MDDEIQCTVGRRRATRREIGRAEFCEQQTVLRAVPGIALGSSSELRIVPPDALASSRRQQLLQQFKFRLFRNLSALRMGDRFKFQLGDRRLFPDVRVSSQS